MAEPAPDQPDAAPARRPNDAAPARRRNDWLSWLVLVLVTTGAISLLAVYLPPRVKMLGLFAIAQGLLAGWVAAWLASAFDLAAASRAAGSVVVFLVLLCGQVGTAVESHRLYQAAEERALVANPKRAAALRMLQSIKLPDNPKSKQVVDDVRHTIGVHGTSFADYLQFRVSDLGIPSRRLALGIWILEVVLGSLAGTWIFRRLAPPIRLEAPGTPAKLEE